MFGRKKRIAEFPDEWRHYLAARVPGWNAMATDERARIEDIALYLIEDKRWEAANGFEIVDEIKVTIAGQAALLVLELPLEYYDAVGTILVRSAPWMEDDHGEHGLVSRDPAIILGETQYQGLVMIVWDAVDQDLRDPHSEATVVFHEFAHKLDELDTTYDGTPPMDDDELRERWQKVCQRYFDEMTEGSGGPNCIVDYAAQSPSEFFAVVTEVFFAHPMLLQEQAADLYEVFAFFYRQDPAKRFS